MLKWHNRAFFMKKLGTVSALCLVSVGKADPSPSHQPTGSRGRDAKKQHPDSFGIRVLFAEFHKNLRIAVILFR